MLLPNWVNDRVSLASASRDLLKRAAEEAFEKIMTTVDCCTVALSIRSVPPRTAVSVKLFRLCRWMSVSNLPLLRKHLLERAQGSVDI